MKKHLAGEKAEKRIKLAVRFGILLQMLQLLAAYFKIMSSGLAEAALLVVLPFIAYVVADVVIYKTLSTYKQNSLVLNTLALIFFVFCTFILAILFPSFLKWVF